MGKTQRDGMGREAGGGLRMGNTCNTWLIHVSVWQKPLQYRKVIKLIKIIGGKKKKIRDTKGICHAKISTIKDTNGMDLTEAEDIKKRW